MINDSRVEKAVEYLRDTAEQHGQLKGAIEFHKYKAKRAAAIAFLAAEGTVAERQHIAMADPEVEKAHDELAEVTADCIKVADQREAAKFTIEVWRTQSASSRAKMI